MSAPTGEFRRGWPTLAGSVIGIAAGLSSLYFYSLGVFILPLCNSFGWTRTQASLGSLAGTLAAAAAAPLAGSLADRFGSLRLAAASLALLALGFGLHGWLIRGLPSFIVVSVLLNLMAIGSAPLAYSRLTASTFHRHRGLALGIALSGTGLGAMLVPAFLVPFITAHGWRKGYAALALTSLLAIVPVWLLLRGTADDIRLASAKQSVMPMVRRPEFAVLAAMFFLAAIAILGTVVQFVPMLSDFGLAPAAVGTLSGLIGMSAVIGRLAIGALLDRFDAGLITRLVFVLAGLGLWLLAWGGVTMALPTALLLGLGIGAEVHLLSFHTARLFPREMFGQINGLLYGIFLVGSGLGPTLSGLLFDVTGSYRASLLIFGIALFAAALFTFRLGPTRLKCGA